MKLVPPRRPVAGRPKPLELCSVILLTPGSDMKLDGLSISSLFKATGREALFKGLERSRDRPEEDISPRVLEGLASVLTAAPPSEIGDLMIRAIAEGGQAREQVNRLGLWRILRDSRKACGATPLDLIPVEHCVEVEDASSEAADRMQQGDYRAAARAFGSQPVLQHYLSGAALEAFGEGGAQASEARQAGALEFLLAQVARADVLTWELRGAVEGMDGVLRLLATRPHGDCRPGRELLRWLMEQVQVRSLAQLMALDGYREHPMTDDSALKRWSSGDEFPTTARFLPFANSVIETAFEGEEAQTMLLHVDIMLWAARRLHKLLEIGRAIQAEVDGARGTGRWQALQGGPTSEEWSRARYAFWLEHWRLRVLPAEG